jgi:peroxiredoxin (alkyl hydroperoxide reductase subunit C)
MHYRYCVNRSLVAAPTDRQDEDMIDTTTAARQPIMIGEMAPDFCARTTLGERSLSQYRGQWLILFSHPADFTPVCTTEFIALAKSAGDFAAAGCALLGLSVDSIYSHMAWVTAIKLNYGVNVPFPIIEDPSMAIGRAYGMLNDAAVDSAKVRSTYFINPEGVVRAITTYPHNVGRSVSEMLRLLRALQITEGGEALAPEGWQPGDRLLALPMINSAEIGVEADWFCHLVDAK